MPAHHFSPLDELLSADASDEARWRTQALAACRQTLDRIDNILTDGEGSDRDLAACLDAVRNSLEWILDGDATQAQLARTVNRAAQVFRSVDHFDNIQ